MSTLEYWQNKSLKLDDDEFSNAMLALGILAFRANKGGQSQSLALSPSQIELFQKQIITVLENILTSEEDSNKNEVIVDWETPKHDYIIRTQMFDACFEKIDLKWLADQWENIIKKHLSANGNRSFRIRIENNKDIESIIPWYSVLLKALPTHKAIHFNLSTKHQEVYMKWPLRLGHFLGTSPGKVLSDVINKWPSSDNAIIVETGRDKDNCDLLFWDGSIAGLKKELVENPANIKCNIVFIRGAIKGQTIIGLKELETLADICKCNGFVLFPNALDDSDYSEYINKVTESLSHNAPFDISLFPEGFDYSNPDFAPVAFLGEPILKFCLESIVDKMVDALEDMPEEAEIEIPAPTFNRLKIPKPEEKIYPSVLKSAIQINRNNIVYHSESMAATGLSELSKSVKASEDQAVVTKARSARFISSRCFIKEQNKFIREERAMVNEVATKLFVAISPPDKTWEQHTEPVPEDKLPPQKEAWRLQVILSEPNHLDKPLIAFIRLPKDGPSTECEFDFTPKKAIPFEGRVTFTHRGRVIQTAIIKSPVVKSKKEMPANKNIRIEDIKTIRSNIGDLDERRQFDLAIVTNHNSNQQPLMTGIAENHAWFVNLERCDPFTRSINEALSEVVHSAADYKKGFLSEKGKELLFKLVFNGCELYDRIIDFDPHQKNFRESFAKKEYLQIIDTRGDHFVPFEFIYDHEAPDDDAVLCKNWKKALSNGKCQKNCSMNQRKTLCPLGFWCLSKVIERHSILEQSEVSGADYYLQSETTANRSELSLQSKALFASSQKVKAVENKTVITTFKKLFKEAPIEVKTWADWEEKVSQNKPSLIVALPHTEYNGTTASLEISNNTIKSIQVRPSHLRPTETDMPPMVALLGCDTTGSGQEYSSFIWRFKNNGASIVFGTMATVLGSHAAKSACMLLKGIASKKAKQNRIGEIMRQMKRDAIKSGLIMALSIVTFGDADWKISGKQ